MKQKGYCHGRKKSDSVCTANFSGYGTSCRKRGDGTFGIKPGTASE
jgi:hypothetical protein